MQKIDKGYIYILQNPSFPDWVKIGYADDVEERLKALNSSECTPFSFRVYATYEVTSRLADKHVHKIIDMLNPELRSVEDLNGHKRVREFYALSAEEVYGLFVSIASITDTMSKLKKWEQTPEAIQDEKIAEEIQTIKRERATPYSFIKSNIPAGAVLEYWQDDQPTSITCMVSTDQRKVVYEGELYSLSGLAQKLLDVNYAVAGPHYFKYDGKWLNEIRHEIGY